MYCIYFFSLLSLLFFIGEITFLQKKKRVYIYIYFFSKTFGSFIWGLYFTSVF